MIIYVLFLFISSFAGLLLFENIPVLTYKRQREKKIKVSVIIPARNEEKKLAFILSDLKKQNFDIHEIICVDDASTDKTYDIIRSFDVTALKILDKPDDWNGKTWACQVGANRATGDLLVFMDADLRIATNVLENLVTTHLKNGHVISVQPYHTTVAMYEQFAFFFNVISVGAIGAACPLSKQKAGLFGPCILISRKHFTKINGFIDVRNSIIEDVELGSVLTKHNIAFSLFVGDKNLTFKMYANFRKLFFGFVKNYSVGALKTPPVLSVLTFLWIQSITAYPLLVIVALVMKNYALFSYGIIMYAITCLHLFKISKKIGSFKKRYIAFYPILLAVFHITFAYSLLLKVFRKKVRWKDRDISLK